MRPAALAVAVPLSLLLTSPARAQLQPPPPSQPAPGAAQPQPAYGQPAYGQPAASSSNTERSLREAEEKDSKRGLEWVWLQAEGGVQQLGLTTLSGSSDKPLVASGSKTSSVGPVAGLSANARLLFFTLGVRGRLSWLSDYQYWTIDPEIGMHFPRGDIEPYFFVGGGYSALAGLKGANEGLKVSGFNLRLGAGLDYFVSPHFSVGGMVTGETVFLSRPKADGASATVNLPAGSSVTTSTSSLASSEGSGTGLAVAGTAVLAMHF